MINSELLSLLACPETKQPLHLGDQTLLDQLNAAIANGKLRNRAHCQIANQLEAVLVREDGQIGYPVWEGIPSLLIDDGIPLGQLESKGNGMTQA